MNQTVIGWNVKCEGINVEKKARKTVIWFWMSSKIKALIYEKHC